MFTILVYLFIYLSIYFCLSIYFYLFIYLLYGSDVSGILIGIKMTSNDVHPVFPGNLQN
jgi:hypothetical protein